MYQKFLFHKRHNQNEWKIIFHYCICHADMPKATECVYTPINLQLRLSKYLVMILGFAMWQKIIFLWYVIVQLVLLCVLNNWSKFMFAVFCNLPGMRTCTYIHTEGHFLGDSLASFPPFSVALLCKLYACYIFYMGLLLYRLNFDCQILAHLDIRNTLKFNYNSRGKVDVFVLYQTV